MDLIIHTLSPRRRIGCAQAAWRMMPCALGRSGLSQRRREGSGATPRGNWPLRQLLFRADRLTRPICGLPVNALKPEDGWCDAPDDVMYNRKVSLPYPACAEHLWRDDGLYDLILVPGINDDPVIRGAGSALFVHVARHGLKPTEGCIALDQRDLLRVLAHLGPGSRLIVR